jgi:hypothetical protein
VTVDGGFKRCGSSDDIVGVANSTIGALAVTTYAGNDRLAIANSNFVGLAANLGVGSLTGQVDAASFMNGGGVGAGIVGTPTASPPISYRWGLHLQLLGINGGEGVDRVVLAPDRERPWPSTRLAATTS